MVEIAAAVDQQGAYAPPVAGDGAAIEVRSSDQVVRRVNPVRHLVHHHTKVAPAILELGDVVIPALTVSNGQVHDGTDPVLLLIEIHACPVG